MTEQIETSEKSSEYESLRNWMLFTSLLSVIAFSTVALIGYSIIQNERERNNREDRQEEEARLIRSIEDCRQDNRDTTDLRAFTKEQIVTVSVIFSREQITREQILDSRAEPLEEYFQYIDTALPYRNCSPHCVEAYLDPDITDCEASDNERGD